MRKITVLLLTIATVMLMLSTMVFADNSLSGTVQPMSQVYYTCDCYGQGGGLYCCAYEHKYNATTGLYVITPLGCQPGNCNGLY